MGSAAREREGAPERGGRTCLESTGERVPRGRCLPPITPAPDPRRGAIMQQSQKQNIGKAENQPSRVVLLSSANGDASRVPMSAWKRGYVSFKRKVGSSAFMPLLLLFAVSGVGLHVVGLTGASLGYFTWSIGCEGVVTVAEEIGRANGQQIYSIGWARYDGIGPETVPDAATLAGLSVENGTAENDLGRGGVAGSSIPKQDWLLNIDSTSAALGGMTAIGHILGLSFYIFVLFFVLRLFRSQFRSHRSLFQPAAKASIGLLVWLVGINGMGFFFAVQENYTEKILTTLGEEGFLCEDGSSVGGDFSYIATGFGCVACAMTSLLIGRFGRAADYALADRFQRKASLAELHP